MAAAVAPYFRIADSVNSPARKSKAGWVGSKAGARNAFVYLDASGYIDQAAAVSNAVASKRVGVLLTDVASTVAADSSDALAVQYRPIRETTRITMPLITSGTSLVTFVTVANTRIGDLVGLARRTAGDYVWDTTGTDYGYVTAVDVTNGWVTASLLNDVRIP